MERALRSVQNDPASGDLLYLDEVTTFAWLPMQGSLTSKS